MKIRINAISSEGIDAYRILRLMPDDSRVSIPSCDWQSSPVFEGMHNGGGYVLQVRDVEGNIAEQIVPIEEPLEVLAYGAFIKDGSVGVSAATNIPSQMRLRWDISAIGESYEAPPLFQLNDMGWNSYFSNGHTRYLPTYYVGTVHHYWIFSRSQYNQRVSVNGRYVITPESVDPIRRTIKLDIYHKQFVFGSYEINSASTRTNIGTAAISEKTSPIPSQWHINSFDTDLRDDISSFEAIEIEAKLTYTIS